MRRGWIVTAIFAVAVACPPGSALAQITVDGTLSPAHSLTGPNYSIPATLGRQVGANLFHSFGLFNVNTDETATFSGPNSVANIIARVTGGSISTIDGTIASTIQGANLFLINPAGMVFGPNAQLQVSGAFHAATADYLRFTDGATFSATTPSGSGLTTAPPQAFGFLGTNSASLSISGSVLAAAGGRQLSLIGGAGGVSVDGAVLSAPSGTIHIASVAGPGEIGVDPTDRASLTATGFGPVSVTDFASVDTGGNPAGAIFIRGGVVTADASSITNEQFGVPAGGGITIIGATSVAVVDGAQVGAQNFGAGTMGPVTLQGGTIAVDFSTVATSNSGAGPGAAVVLSGSDIRITGNSFVGAFTLGPAPSGAVMATASNSLTVDGTGFEAPTGIVTFVVPGASGNAGAVTISAGSTMQLLAGGLVGSETQGSGNAGPVSVTAGSIAIDASTSLSLGSLPGGIFSLVDGVQTSAFLNPSGHPATGNAGTVNVTAAGSITVTGSAQITGATFGAGAGGAVMVHGGSILIDASLTPNAFTGINADGEGGSTGHAGNVTVIGNNSVVVSNFGSISSNALGVGSGGAVEVDAPQIAISGGGTIASVSIGAGNGGAVTVNAGTLTIDGAGTDFNTGLTTVAVTGSTGAAGNIVVDAATIDIIAGGAISSTTLSPGRSGDIAINAGTLAIDGAGGLAQTGVFANAEPGSTGDAGAIRMAVNQLTISNGGLIHTVAQSSGNAGSVTIDATGIALSSDAFITSDTSGSGNAGTVTITTGTLNLSTNAAISSSTNSSGNAGTVTITAGTLAMASNGGISTSTAGSGNGGAVLINASSIIALGGDIVSGTSGGNAGTITINAGDVTLSGTGGIDSSTAGTADAGSVTLAVTGSLAVSSGAGIGSASRSTGNAGKVTITAGNIDVLDAIIFTDTAIFGSAGKIDITAGSLLVSAGGMISSSAGGTGTGGNITLAIARDALLQGATSSIQAQSFGSGPAGSITLSAARLILINGATISTQATLGGGGDIAIHAGTLVDLVYSGISTSVAGGNGNGGNILIDPPAVVLDHGFITANAFGGNGGNIIIDASILIDSPGSLITASSTLGISGTITIAAPSTDVTAGLAELSGKTASPPRIAREGCLSVARLENASRLVVGGLGGLPPDATEPLSLGYFGGDPVGGTATLTSTRATVAQDETRDAAIVCR